MKKYRFRIFGDNAEKLDVPHDGVLPILFEAVFYSNEDEDALDKMTDEIFKVVNNPQRVGAPMSKGKVEPM